MTETLTSPLFVYDDGGRTITGYKGDAGDCVCRSIAIVTEQPYQTVYDALNGYGKQERITRRNRKQSSARNGVRRETIKKYLTDLGWTWTPLMTIGSGCKTHVRANELPAGRLILRLSKHLTAMIDGVIHDTYDPSRDGMRCVYGYWSKEK